MDINNLYLILLDDNIVERNNVIRYIIEEVQEQVPINDFDIEERGVRKKNENYFEEIVPLYTELLFKEHFRMSRAAIDELENIIGNTMEGNQNHPIILRKKILFSIWILAKQESYLAAGDRFNLAKSTAHGILKEIVTVLIQLMPYYITWSDRQNCMISSIIFEERSRGFPGIVGVIDGCHIPCKAPPYNANDFYNRKSFHSIILQGICDHKARFINVYIGLPGRMHDAAVFRYSDIYRQLTNAEEQLLLPQLHLIGDSAYPLLQNLMTPFRDNGHLTRAQVTYNNKLSSVRSIIERAFGFLKGKFRRLRYLDIADFELGNKMIGAACILHNFMINKGEIDLGEDIDINNDLLLINHVNNLHHEENEISAFAVEKRNNLMYLIR